MPVRVWEVVAGLLPGTLVQLGFHTSSDVFR